jgi:predicted AlkP superfamily pyrophosphatase or phosphodiesterase
VVFQPGFYAGAEMSGDLVTPIAARNGGEAPGGHGFSPADASMRAAFFAAGSGIAHHRDLGVIDMRQIAPTVARLLSVPMPTAPAAPLELAR